MARFVCLYDVEEKILLRRVQISHNRSLDGVLDQLNSKHMTDAGPAALLDVADTDEDELLPPTTSGAAADHCRAVGGGCQVVQGFDKDAHSSCPSGVLRHAGATQCWGRFLV